jgi:hypothetical protein
MAPFCIMRVGVASAGVVSSIMAEDVWSSVSVGVTEAVEQAERARVEPRRSPRAAVFFFIQKEEKEIEGYKKPAHHR